VSQEKWGTIWDHLEDFRRTLLSSLFVIGIGFFAILAFYQPLFEFLTRQQIQLDQPALVKRTIQREIVENHTQEPLLFALPADARLVESSSKRKIFDGKGLLIEPGESLIYEIATTTPLLIMGPIEGIALVMKTAFWLSLTLTAPLWGWLWFRFISPGLHKGERALVLPFFFLSVFFLSAGFVFAYYITLPIANQYLSAFNHSLGQNAWTLTHYINYVLLLCFGHAVAAELTLILFMLVHLRVLSPAWLINKRRVMVVFAFILGAVLTPPDVLTQLFLALPLIAVYELAICYAKYLERAHLRRT
jgi:sec-independent protein translocase protein TatC